MLLSTWPSKPTRRRANRFPSAGAFRPALLQSTRVARRARGAPEWLAWHALNQVRHSLTGRRHTCPVQAGLDERSQVLGAYVWYADANQIHALNQNFGRRRDIASLVLADERLCAAKANGKLSLRLSSPLPGSANDGCRVFFMLGFLHSAQHRRYDALCESQVYPTVNRALRRRGPSGIRVQGSRFSCRLGHRGRPSRTCDFHD